MSICSFSTEYLDHDFVKVDHSFIREFVPNTPDSMLKVYLYGLYSCTKGITMEEMCQALHLTEEDIESAFLFWEEMGLVTILSTSPLDVRYLPSKYGSMHLKKYNKDKYADFNIKVQEILSGRMLTPNEFNEYYYLIEHLHFEQDALLMLIKHCVNLKNNKIGYSYIVTVAKNFASDNITTCEKMEERLALQERSTSDVKLILATLKQKHTPTIEECEMYLNWTEVHGLQIDVLQALAKKVKFGGMERLNQLVTQCIENKLYSVKEIEDYFDQRDMLYQTSRDVCKNLGLRYENLDPIMENYLVPWTTYGFDSNTLKTYANYCFKQNIRTLDGMNFMIEKLYKLGIITLENLESYLEKQSLEDQKVKEILDKLGLNRMVTQTDRKFYQTWTIDWRITQEVLEHAITISQDKALPMQYLNKLLSTYHTQNITTVEQAKNCTIAIASEPKGQAPKKSSIKQRTYSSTQMSNLIQNIKEIDL